MNNKERITLEEVINLIGDEVGNKYSWFLIGFDAQGVISERSTIRETLNPRNWKIGYYEISWDEIKELSRKLSAVVVFNIIASKSKDDFLKERAKLNQEVHDWTGMVCELDFWIEDGEIWEISGNDEFLVKRLQKTFSKLPKMLM